MVSEKGAGQEISHHMSPILSLCHKGVMSGFSMLEMLALWTEDMIDISLSTKGKSSLAHIFGTLVGPMTEVEVAPLGISMSLIHITLTST